MVAPGEGSRGWPYAPEGFRELLGCRVGVIPNVSCSPLRIWSIIDYTRGNGVIAPQYPAWERLIVSEMQRTTLHGV